jgi:hypothetical protein
MIIATTTVTLAHRVSLRHASTGAPIAPVGARLDHTPHGWSLRVRGADVLLTARQGAPAPAATPTLTVWATDPQGALMLATPTVDVPLTGPDLTIDVEPVPMTLTVELVRPTTGAPRTGRTVAARATSGPNPRPTVPLPEVSPGLYRSAPVRWTARHTPLDLRVDGSLLRQMAVDFTRTETRVRLIDTT